jgi:hypothetical protein
MATSLDYWGADRISNGVPAVGVDAVYTLTIGGAPLEQAGSGFYLSQSGLYTSLILWSATNATLVGRVDAALEALSSLGTGGITTAVGTMTTGVGTITMTAAGVNVKRKIAPILLYRSVLAGASPTVTVTETTTGVDAFGVGLSPGMQAINGATGIIYFNSGTAASPVWTPVP